MKNKKTKNGNKSEYLYFSGSEETVIRADETQKQEVIANIKKRRIKKYALNITSYVLVFAIIISGFYLGKKGIEKFLVLRQELQNNNDLTIPDSIKTKLDALTEEEQWAYLYKEHPELLNVKFPAGILYDYALFYAENPQTVGYLKIDGTKIDTPVVQADNNKYYITHDFYNKTTSYGAIFANTAANMQTLDRNTLLYGHNMHDGSRFAELINYKSIDFFKQHPIIQFDTLFEKHQWKIYAVMITEGSTETNNGYFFDFTFNQCSDTCFEEYIEELDKRKLYETGVDLLPTDKILTLCTCTYEFDDARLVVIARQVRDGESPEVDTKLAGFKTTPVKYPECYYDNQRNNPYKDDEKFYLY
ncbi:MAG: class B sortase [Acutalibacteraceae bacterium]